MNRVRYRRVAAIGTCVTRVTKEWDVRPQRLDRVGDHHGSDRALVATSRSALNWGKFLSIPTSYKGTSIVINQTRETTTCTSLAAFDMPEGKSLGIGSTSRAHFVTSLEAATRVSVDRGSRRSSCRFRLEQEACDAGLPLRWPPRLPNSRYALEIAEWVRRQHPIATCEIVSPSRLTSEICL